MACHHLRGRGMALAIGPGRGFPDFSSGFSVALTAAAVLWAATCASAPNDSSSSGVAADLACLAADTMLVRAGALTDPVTPSAAGVVTRIDLDDRSGSRDLAGELAHVAGIQVRRYGGVGFAAVPALRGASAAQIRIFLDGIPLNSAQTGRADLNRLPVERFTAAEVHRGAVPTGLGGMGGAGAINLITRDRAEGTELRLFGGSWSDAGGRLTWGASGDDGRRSVLLMLHGRRADNDYRYLDHNQTFHETGDDTSRIRENAWYEEWGLWGTARQETDELRVRLAGGFFRQDGGRPGPLNYPSPHAAVRAGRGSGQLHLDWRRNLSLDFAGAVQDQYLYDPQNEIDDGFGGTVRSRSEDVVGRLSWSGRLWTAADAGALLSGLDLVAGLEERRQWYRQWYGDDQDPRRSRRTTSAFAGATVGLAANRLRVLPAWRWQRNRDDFPPLPPLPWLPEESGVEHRRDDVSPSLGAVWEICRDRLFVQGHTARSVRVPTWIELFGHRGGIDGNRDLLPEEITVADAALTWRSVDGRHRLRWAFFQARTEATIIFIQNSPGTSKARNIGQTRTRGLELEGALVLPGGSRFTGNLTCQEALDQGEDPAYNGKDLPFLSDVAVWARLDRPSGSWGPWLEFSWESEKYRDRANTETDRAPARTLVDLGLEWRTVPGFLGPAGELTVAAEVANVFDDTTYDVEEFPLPGRSWQLSLRLRR